MKQSVKRSAVAVSFALGLAAVGGVAATHGPMAAPKVQVAPARLGDLQPEVFGIGTVEARLSYVIGPTSAGRVAALHVDHGDTVKAGQLLGEIDPVDLEERVQGALLSSQRAKLAVAALEAQVREADSRHKLALANAERYRDLVTRNFVSREAAEARQHEADMARAALDGAKASLEAARRDAARTEAELRGIARQRENLKLISPADGIVVSREAEPGNTVVAGQAVLRVIDPRSLWVRARLDQASSKGLRLGQPAQIVLRSRQDVAWKGRVARIEIQSDSLTEERLVDIAFDEMPPERFTGELAEVTVRLEPLKNALFIPTAAVRRLNGRTGVWRVENDRVRFYPVTTGTQTPDGRTQVVDGLLAGDGVIVYAPTDLNEGAKVRIGKTT